MGNELTTTEMTTLEFIEDAIQKSIASFIEIGRGLTEIRNGRLYRGTHSTFEDYCRERWDMTHRNANYLIGASEIVGHLGTIVPKTESQVRPLTKLEDPEQQRKAWEKACERAEDENRSVVARDVTHAVKWVESKSSEPDPEPDPKPSEPPVNRQSVGCQFATIAILQLKKIVPSDTERDMAYVKVVRWLANKRFPTSKTPLEKLFKLVAKESKNE